MITIDNQACRIAWCFSDAGGQENTYWGCICYDEVCPGLVRVWSNDNTTGSTVNVALEGYADNAAFIAELDAYNDVCCAASGAPTDPTINEGQKCIVTTQTVVDPENKKESILLYLWQNPVTKETCWTDDIEGNNIININDFTMSNFAGLPPALDGGKTIEKTLEICTETTTLQDVLDAAVAAGVEIDGTPVDGIIGLEIVAEYKGQQCAGETTIGQGAEYGAAPAIVSLDGGQKFCEALKYADADCDGLADACYDLTTPLVKPAGNGIIVNAIYALCDDDPTTAAATK